MAKVILKAWCKIVVLGFEHFGALFFCIVVFVLCLKLWHHKILSGCQTKEKKFEKRREGEKERNKDRKQGEQQNLTAKPVGPVPTPFKFPSSPLRIKKENWNTTLLHTDSFNRLSHSHAYLCIKMVTAQSAPLVFPELIGRCPKAELWDKVKREL